MVDVRVALSEENDRLTDTVAKQAAEIERLRAALRKIADNKQVRGDCFCGACLQARHARAALEERT